MTAVLSTSQRLSGRGLCAAECLTSGDCPRENGKHHEAGEEDEPAAAQIAVQQEGDEKANGKQAEPQSEGPQDEESGNAHENVVSSKLMLNSFLHYFSPGCSYVQLDLLHPSLSLCMSSPLQTTSYNLFVSDSSRHL